MREVWVVGRWPDEPGKLWELQGVYPTEERARSNSEEGWFAGPVPFDEPFPVETTAWPVHYLIDGEWLLGDVPS